MKMDNKICKFLILMALTCFYQAVVCRADEVSSNAPRVANISQKKNKKKKNDKSISSKALKVGGVLVFVLTSYFVLEKYKFFDFLPYRRALDPAEKFENEFKGAPENRLCVKLSLDGCGMILGFKKPDANKYSILNVSIDEDYMVCGTEDELTAYKGAVNQDKEDFGGFIKDLVGSDDSYVFLENGYFIIPTSDPLKCAKSKGKVHGSDGTAKDARCGLELLGYERKMKQNPLLFRLVGEGGSFGSLSKDELVAILRDNYGIDIFPDSVGGFSPPGYPSLT